MDRETLDRIVTVDFIEQQVSYWFWFFAYISAWSALTDDPPWYWSAIAGLIGAGFAELVSKMRTERTHG